MRSEETKAIGANLDWLLLHGQVAEPKFQPRDGLTIASVFWNTLTHAMGESLLSPESMDSDTGSLPLPAVTCCLCHLQDAKKLSSIYIYISSTPPGKSLS